MFYFDTVTHSIRTCELIRYQPTVDEVTKVKGTACVCVVEDFDPVSADLDTLEAAPADVNTLTDAVLICSALRGTTAHRRARQLVADVRTRLDLAALRRALVAKGLVKGGYSLHHQALSNSWRALKGLNTSHGIDMLDEVVEVWAPVWSSTGDLARARRAVIAARLHPKPNYGYEPVEPLEFMAASSRAVRHLERGAAMMLEALEVPTASVMVLFDAHAEIREANPSGFLVASLALGETLDLPDGALALKVPSELALDLYSSLRKEKAWGSPEHFRLLEAGRADDNWAEHVDTAFSLFQAAGGTNRPPDGSKSKGYANLAKAYEAACRL